MKQIISIHVPKSGGTTFIGILQSIYGDKFRIDRRDIPHMGGFRGAYIKGEHDCIHGHFQKKKYESWNYDFITWVRHPVERMISQYYKQRTQRAGRRDEHQVKLKTDKLSLIEFAELKQNEMTEVYFNNCKPSDFAFIGILEKFNSSLDRFEKYLGVKIKRDFEIKNQTKHKEVISPNKKKQIEEIMSKDMKFYNAVLMENRQ